MNKFLMLCMMPFFCFCENPVSIKEFAQKQQSFITHQMFDLGHRDTHRYYFYIGMYEAYGNIVYFIQDNESLLDHERTDI